MAKIALDSRLPEFTDMFRVLNGLEKDGIKNDPERTRQLMTGDPRYAEWINEGKEARLRLRDHFRGEVKNLFLDRKISEKQLESLLFAVDASPVGQALSPEEQDGFRKKNVPPIYWEMLQGAKVINEEHMRKHDLKLKKFAEEIDQKIDDSWQDGYTPTLYITGEGSSIAIPGYLAESIAASLGYLHVNVVSKCCAEVKDVNFKDIVVVMSNSGKTATAIKLAQKAEKAGALCFGITQNPKSKLAEVCGEENTVILNCGKEGAVGATKSVVEQSMVISALLKKTAHECNNDSKDDTDYEEISRTYGESLTSKIPREIVYQISKARELVIIGGEGVHREAALKAAETIGKKVRIIDRPFGLHGDEETFTPDDTVLFLDPYLDTIADIEKHLITERIEKGKKPVPVFYLTSDESVRSLVPDAEKRVLMAPKNENYQPIMNLGVIQRMLVDVAVYQGKDCTPEFARKVGHEHQDPLTVEN